MAQHFSGKVALKAVIEQEGKILLVRDINDADIWEIPGGRLDENETPEDGLKRELREELGVAVDVHELIYTEQSLHTQKGEWTLFLIFRATLLDANAMLTPAPEEIAEVAWIEKSALDTQKIYDVYRKGVEAFLKSTAA